MRQAKTSRIFRICLIVAAACLLAVLVWGVFLRPTRILVANATLAQQADVALNNDSRRIHLKFADAAQLAADGKSLRGIDAVVIFSRGLYLDDGQVAALAGNPRWARVVGYALHVNPDPSGIPCYRVVTKDGRISDAFAFGGGNEQIALLKADGIEFIDETHVDMKRFQWRP